MQTQLRLSSSRGACDAHPSRDGACHSRVTMRTGIFDCSPPHNVLVDYS
jgi:hypothetical protein